MGWSRPIRARVPRTSFSPIISGSSYAGCSLEHLAHTLACCGMVDAQNGHFLIDESTKRMKSHTGERNSVRNIQIKKDRPLIDAMIPLVIPNPI